MPLTHLNSGTRTTFTFLAAVFGFLMLSSCQKGDSNDLQEAQSCLNTAPAASARACVDKIANDNSAAANSLKCSAIFISEGYGAASSFVDAIESINNTGGCTGGCSSTVNALNALSFKSGNVAGDANARTKNNQTAAEAFNVCSKANVKFYTQISSLFKIGTEVAMLAYAAGIGGTTPTENEIKAQISNMDAEPLGQLVTTTYNSACQDTQNASDATKKYCAELQTAIAGYSTNTQIGNCLKIKLADPNAACPP